MHPAIAQQERYAAEQFARVLAVPLPADVRAALSPLQLAYAFEWFRDFAPAKAATRAGYRDANPHRWAYRLEAHAGIVRAREVILAALAAERDDGRTLDWVELKLKELHAISSASVPVLDRKGLPTGEYRVDGGTAARCLELIGKLRGGFAQAVDVVHRGEVRHLLAAVAARGKPSLEQRRPSLTLSSTTGKPED